MTISFHILILDAEFLTIHDGLRETKREVLRTKQPPNLRGRTQHGNVSRYGLPGAIPGCTVGENVYSNHGYGRNLDSWTQWKPLETSRNLFLSVN